MRTLATPLLLAAALIAAPRPLAAQDAEGEAEPEAAEAALPQVPGAAVTLPWREVKRLFDRANEAARKEEERAREPVPPAEAVVESARYEAVVGRASTEVEATFQVDLLVDAWQQVRLLGEGPAVVSATIDGKPARLRLDEEWYVLVARGRGRKTVVMRFVLPKGTEAGDSGLDLKVAGSAKNHLELTIPRRSIAVSVEPVGALRHGESGGTTRVTADFPHTEDLRVSWSGALAEREVQKVKVVKRCGVSQLVSVGGGLVKLDARLAFSILQGSVERFDLQLPPDTTLLDVSGEEVREHRVVKHDRGSAVAVSLSRPVSGEFAVRVLAERAMEGTSTVAAVPELRILDLDREWGWVGINATTNIEVRQAAAAGLTRIDVKELPADVWQAAQHPILLSYRYAGHPYDLKLDVRRHEDLSVLASTIDSASVVTFLTDDGKVLHSALFQVKNTQQQFMRARLPAGSRVLAAFVSDLPVKPASDRRGEVLVPLEKSAAGQSDQRPFPVELLYLEEGSAMGILGRSRLETLKVIDMPISLFRWTLHLPRRYTYWGFASTLEKGSGWEPAPRGGGDPAARKAAERLESQAGGKASGSVGLLPVRIAFPTSGRRYSFQSDLVMDRDEPPSVAFRFVGAAVTKTLRILVGVAAALVAVRAARLLIARRKGEETAEPLQRLTWLVGAMVLVVVLETWAFGASVPSIAATLVAAIICTDAYVSFRAADERPAA